MEDNGDDKQMQKIQEEKSALAKQMVLLIILSFLVSGAFYGITLLQNPYASP
jgi:p-aminobenzoyl-glutamate transporter AbgT